MKGMLRTVLAVFSAGTLAMNVLAILMFAMLSDLSEVDWGTFLLSTAVSAVVFILVLKDLSKDNFITSHGSKRHNGRKGL